jgi:hypothetical protein
MNGTGRRCKGDPNKYSEAPLVSIYDGRTCIGFVLARNRSGFEAFDANELSKGLFATQELAIAALSTAGAPA